MENKEITIQDTMNKRVALEREIARLLLEFSSLTDMSVERIGLTVIEDEVSHIVGYITEADCWLYYRG